MSGMVLDFKVAWHGIEILGPDSAIRQTQALALHNCGLDACFCLYTFGQTGKVQSMNKISVIALSRKKICKDRQRGLPRPSATRPAILSRSGDQCEKLVHQAAN